MIDLACLVADKNMEAAVQAILARPEAMGIRAIDREYFVHPRRDPGCFHESAEILRGYRDRASHALVLLDHAWDGAPGETGEALEQLLGQALANEFDRDWVEPVVIDPELEVWVFSDSPHVAAALGWADTSANLTGANLRTALQEHGFWPEGTEKPSDPKAAVHFALRAARKPRSSSIYRELGDRVSLERCRDRAFLRFKRLLASWFPR